MPNLAWYIHFFLGPIVRPIFKTSGLLYKIDFIYYFFNTAAYVQEGKLGFLVTSKE